MNSRAIKSIRRTARTRAIYLRALVASVGLFVAVSVASQACTGLHAEILSLLADAAMARHDWAPAYDNSQRALQLAPKTYRYLEQAAVSTAKMGRHSDAYELRIAALRQRPSSPYAWAELARSTLEHGIHPERLDASLRAVHRLGDQERSLWALFAIQAIERSYISLTPYAKSYLQGALKRELTYRPLQLLGYALLRHRERDICSMPEGRPTKDYLCETGRYMRQTCETNAVLSAEQQKWCTGMLSFWRQFSYPRAP